MWLTTNRSNGRMSNASGPLMVSKSYASRCCFGVLSGSQSFKVIPFGLPNEGVQQPEGTAINMDHPATTKQTWTRLPHTKLLPPTTPFEENPPQLDFL